MARLRLSSTFVGLGLSFLAAACSVLPGEDEGSSSNAVAVAGRWKLPTAVATAGAKVRLKYDGAPAYSSKACSGKLKTGSNRLGEYLKDRFTAVSSVGGYACRPNTADRSKLSVHGTGRALDIFIPKVGGAADNTRGDAVANWLVTNSARIGVQLVIWDRTIWQANGKADKQYGGPHPHDDHLHVELTIPASSMQTPWFSDPEGGDAGPLEDETNADAGSEEETTRADAGAPTPRADAGTSEPEPEPEPEPIPDEPEPPADPTPTPGSDTDTADPTPADSDSDSAQPGELGEASEEPLLDDEPGEDESEGPSTSSSKKKSRYNAGDEAIASSGCSAAPSGAASSGVIAPLALVLAACLVRRRRRA
ncbi:MAG: hypothetical protein K0S65_5117 [Labilithrix sp.]|nr:hypothetical protein [Labilithrix sp.]